MRRLAWVVPLSIVLIFLMLFAAFGSLRSALLVLANLPFALVGGVLVLALAEINLSVSAAVGFIALFGIAVENGMVLVTFFNQLVRRGHSVEEAVRQGCMLRLRPLLMTDADDAAGALADALRQRVRRRDPAPPGGGGARRTGQLHGADAAGAAGDLYDGGAAEGVVLRGEALAASASHRLAGSLGAGSLGARGPEACGAGSPTWC